MCVSKRGLYLANAALLLLFMGLVYAWSIFVTPMEAEFGWTRSQTSLTFSICMSCFCVGGFTSGLILKRHSPFVVMLLCALCLTGGFTLTSRIDSLTGLYITYGVLVGFGIGLAYNCANCVIVGWFPEKPAFASGVALMGFGLGGLVLGSLSTAMIAALGWRSTFSGLAIAFGAIVLFCSLFLKNPPKEAAASSSSAPVRNDEENDEGKREKICMVRRLSFWIFFPWVVLLTAAGFTLVGNASLLPLDMGCSLKVASLLTGVVSVFNGAGRVIVGILCDKFGCRKAMFGVSTGFIVSFTILILAISRHSPEILTIGYICAGFSFGGIVPINSAVCYSFYGSENYAINFSIINLNAIIASFVGPFLSSGLQALTGSFISVAVVMIGFGTAALALTLILKKP